jgi:hypothetical protein
VQETEGDGRSGRGLEGGKVERSGAGAGACGTTYYLPYAVTQEPRKSEGGWE